MELARVIGTVVATQQVPGLRGVKLLLVEALDEVGVVHGEPFVVADVGQAGPGDTVSWVGGREATLLLPETFVPVDAAIVSIVDDVNARPLAEPATKSKSKSKSKSTATKPASGGTSRPPKGTS